MDAIYTECGPSSCTTTVRAGSFFAPTKAEANALARDALNKAGVMRKACCDTPDMFGCVGQGITESFSVILGKPPFQWSLIWGSIPVGLHISFQDDGRTMIISGVPTTAGNLMGVFTMLDGNGTVLTKTIQFYIVGITDDTLPAAVVGTAYSHQLTAVGGSGSYYFQISAGALPAGLSLSSTGLISGVPTGVGTSSFQVSLTDQAKDNPINANLNAFLQSIFLQAHVSLAEHTYRLQNFAGIYAVPTTYANLQKKSAPQWDGMFEPYQPYGFPWVHSTESRFPNYRLGPQATLYAHTYAAQDTPVVNPGQVINFWRLRLWFPKIPNMPIYIPGGWGGTYGDPLNSVYDMDLGVGGLPDGNGGLVAGSTFPVPGFSMASVVWVMMWEGILMSNSTSPAGVYTVTAFPNNGVYSPGIGSIVVEAAS